MPLVSHRSRGKQHTAAPPGATLPDGHAPHCCAPTLLLLVLTAQSVQVDDLVLSAYFPTGQGVQPPLPAVEYVPAAQASQRVLSVLEAVPAVQVVQAVAPGPTETLPLVQLSHAD